MTEMRKTLFSGIFELCTCGVGVLSLSFSLNNNRDRAGHWYLRYSASSAETKGGEDMELEYGTGIWNGTEMQLWGLQRAKQSKLIYPFIA